MKKNKTIFGSAILVILVMLGSKFLGFLRQTILAAVYGSNIDMDIYFMSSDFIIGLSGALLASLTTALVTVYIDIKIKDNKESANAVASKMLTMFLLASVAFIAIINIFAMPIAKMLAPSYNLLALEKLVTYLRFFSITFVFTAFQSIYAAVLNANESFVPGKLYGIVYNPIVIVMVLLLAGKYGTKPLIIAYIIANLIQTFLLKFLCRKNFKFKPSVNFSDDNVKNLILLSIPLLLSNLFIQLNGVVDKSICSTLGEGFASYYSYAYTLEQFVTATITATVSLLLLSRYATYVAEGNTEMVEKTFKESISGMLLILVPITSVVCALAYDIVSIVYLRGKFTSVDALYTSYALIGFAVGFAIIAIREMYIRLHFSYQDTKMPMISNIASVILNTALSIVLAKFIGIFGVSIATSISAILTVIMLNKSAKKYIPNFKFSMLLEFIVKVLLAGVGAYLVASILNNVVSINILIKFILCAGASFIIYLSMLGILGCNELNEFIKVIKERLAKKK